MAASLPLCIRRPLRKESREKLVKYVYQYMCLIFATNISDLYIRIAGI